jgi:hypothetical protein
MRRLALVALALAILIALAFACSSSSSGPTNGGSDAAFEAAPPGDRLYLDDAGVEHHADGGLTASGCLTLGGLLGEAKVNAKSCANVPGVCQATVKDECGCAVFVEDPTNDYAKSFAAFAAEFLAANCPQKCGACPDTSDGGLCAPQGTGPLQCTP